MQAIEVADREIERRLDAYARARLSPDRASTARVRARVLREARLRFEGSRNDIQLAPVIAFRANTRSMGRRVAMPLAAAGLWLGIAVGSISAAQAGGPLYPTRIWIEHAALPSVGAERANAELGRLDARVGEAMSAAAHGDAGAVQAALEAYRQIADEMVSATAGDANLEKDVAAALVQRGTILTAVATSLAAKGNDTAEAAVEASIQRAIAHTKVVVDALGASARPGTGGDAGNGTGGAAGAGSGDGGAGKGTGSGAGGPAPSSRPGSGGGGSGSGPVATPKPDHTPKPTASPDPGHGQPEHTPRGNE